MGYNYKIPEQADSWVCDYRRIELCHIADLCTSKLISGIYREPLSAGIYYSVVATPIVLPCSTPMLPINHSILAIDFSI